MRRLFLIGAINILTWCIIGAQNCEFVIVIPSYNNERWANKNLQSACFQKSTLPYKVIYINDCSTDGTGAFVDTFVKDHALESKVTVIHNKNNLGVLANWYTTIHSIDDHKIVVNLDGDDILAHDEVLLTLEKYYADPDTWLTYGSALSFPSMKRLPWMSKALPASKEVRKYGFITQHLRTFKAGLFKKINKTDLLYKGSFFKAAADVAFMVPLMEMCLPAYDGAKNHAIFIPEILYYYRRNNNESISRTKKKLQKRMCRYIKSKKKYEPLVSFEY